MEWDSPGDGDMMVDVDELESIESIDMEQRKQAP
jgi:hypothetical protein